MYVQCVGTCRNVFFQYLLILLLLPANLVSESPSPTEHYTVILV